MRNTIKSLLWVLSMLFIACGEVDVETLTIESLVISPKSVSINIGESAQLNAVSTPAYDNNIFSWSTSNDAVATVDENGLVTAVGLGSAKILCKHLDELTAMATITVIDPTQKPEPEPEPEPTPEPEPEPESPAH